MDSKTPQYVTQLESADRDSRINALRRLADSTDLTTTPFGEEVNNHVHTRYSFSPYYPASVAYHARRAGLQVVGSVDHESIGAAREMKEAAAIVGMGATVGCEVRASFADTEFARRRLNNPDTVGNAYMVIHGVPGPSLEALAEWLKPLNVAREERNRRQVANLNGIIQTELGSLDYDRDVRSLSLAHEGGSVTERHILYALALRVLDAVVDGTGISTFLTERLEMEVAPAIASRIDDETNPHRVYDLLGAFKATFVPQFFIQPGTVECPPVAEVNAFARALGAIPAYAYLGDVEESPTGDKKAQQFEDSFLDELFTELPRLGYQAVTYMPPRNTMVQLRRVQELAAGHNLMEISGVDINSSRQSFHCPEVLEPEFRHLIESTWALVGHEEAAQREIDRGLFGTSSEAQAESISRRVGTYAAIGRATTERRRR